MGSQGRVGDQFRERLRSEREHRGWSQRDVARSLSAKGVPSMMWTTIAKIENGDRAVRVDEAAAFATLFGVSVDALLGRNITGSDLLWAISKLTSNAEKFAMEVSNLYDRLAGELADVRHYATQRNSADELIYSTETAMTALDQAKRALQALANEFPLIGVKG